MTDNIRKETRSAGIRAGIGTGYLSLMMIFVVLCLTVLAALSFSAAESGRRFSVKSSEYTGEYYAADIAAKEKLAEIDAVLAEYTDFRDFMLISDLEDIDGIEYTELPDAIEISWLTPINERQNLYYKGRFSGGELEIVSRQTVSGVPENDDRPLGVWLGE